MNAAQLLRLRDAVLDDPAWAFCLLVGPLLLAFGVYGLIAGGTEFETSDNLPSHELLRSFDFNGWHHVLHLVTAAPLVAGALRRQWARGAALFFGAVYIVVTPLGFLDGDDVANVVYSHTADNFIHLTLGILGIGAALLSRR
jgi:hypothetical protein